MIDSDLSRLYGCKNGTKEINQAVKNNMDKFPERFYFQLSLSELNNLKSKKLTSSWNSHGGIRRLLYVFTEQGVYMLATILKTKQSTSVTIKIMDTFVEMRKFIYQNKNTYKEITIIRNKLLEHDNQISKLFNKFNNNLDIKQRIFFNGEIFSAYELVIYIIKRVNEKIIIIDNYMNDSILKILSKKRADVLVLLITNDKNKRINLLDIDKFNKEYPYIKIKYNNDFHDRFILLDDKELYHLGSSIKDLGNRVFAINKIEDGSYINDILKRVKN